MCRAGRTMASLGRVAGSHPTPYRAASSARRSLPDSLRGVRAAVGPVGCPVRPARPRGGASRAHRRAHPETLAAQRQRPVLGLLDRVAVQVHRLVSSRAPVSAQSRARVAWRSPSRGAGSVSPADSARIRLAEAGGDPTRPGSRRDGGTRSPSRASVAPALAAGQAGSHPGEEIRRTIGRKRCAPATNVQRDASEPSLIASAACML